MKNPKLNSSEIYIKLKKINTLLSVFICVMSFYLIIFPIIPEIELGIKKIFVDRPSSINLKDNTLVIPKIYVDAKLSDTGDLDNGPVLLKDFQKTDAAGTKVIAGHRFYKIFGGNTFYHLDKLDKGDLIVVSWEGKKHEYLIKEKFEVSPSRLEEILEEENQDILYLYTCTPLWTAQKRLVMRAVEKK